MRTIGILGGLGPESTISYYAYITRKYHELHKDYAYPEIIIYSARFSDYIDTGYEIADNVKAAIESLHRAGADFVIAACNSVHIVYEQVASDLPIPWISIMDATAEEIIQQQMSRIGLLGTIFTMGKGFYHRALARYGIETIVPQEEQQNKVNGIIYGELVIGEVQDDSRRYVLECIAGLKESGAQGIVLGCTELPFLIQQGHTDIRVFDTTVIHAQKALDLAMEAIPPTAAKAKP